MLSICLEAMIANKGIIVAPRQLDEMYFCNFWMSTVFSAVAYDRIEFISWPWVDRAMERFTVCAKGQCFPYWLCPFSIHEVGLFTISHRVPQDNMLWTGNDLIYVVCDWWKWSAVCVVDSEKMLWFVPCIMPHLLLLTLVCCLSTRVLLLGNTQLPYIIY